MSPKSPKLTLFSLLIILGTIFGLTQRAEASQIVISEDTVWNKDEIKIIDSTTNEYGLTILPGATLTINPGTIIKMNYNATIYVQGKLDVKGDENNPVIITSIKNDEAGGDTNGDATTTIPQSGDWSRITVASWGVANIDYAEVSYAGLYASPILVDNNGTMNITHSNLVHNTGIIRLSPYSNFKMNYSNVYPDTRIWRNIFGVTTYIYPSINNTGYKTFDVSNNYWGNENGPTITPITKAEDLKGIFLYGPSGTFTYQSYLTTPWKPEKKTPVIIVPGIMGSVLRMNNESKAEIWPNFLEMAISKNDLFLNELILSDSIGYYPLNIIPADILKDVGNNDFFDGLINELKNNGYKEGENLFVFPYDWRLDIDYLAGHGAANDPNTLANKIQDILELTKAEKVNIVAHSMGGLIVKRYLEVFDDSRVNSFIDIGTPHLGALKAFKILMYGDDLEIKRFNFGLNEQRVFDISQNFPSIYQLLPSRNYFDNTDPDYSSYISDVYDYDDNGIKGNLDYNQSMEFLKNTGRNNYLIDISETLHNDLDNFNPNDYNVKAYNIVGCGQPTLGKIYVLNKEKSGKYEYGLKYINGDGTVPLKSAEYLNNAEKVYYSNDTTHPYLPSFNGIKQLISSILDNKENDFNFSQHENIRQDKNNCALNGTQISFHSPIELHVYDENNNHIGPNENGDTELNIEGAAYDIIDDNKFVFLPKGHNYKVIGKATDIGTFNARVQNIENGKTIQTTYFNELPLNSTNAIAEINIQDEQTSYEIKMDQDGDNIFENTEQPSSVLNQEESTDIEKPQTDINIQGEKGNNNWHISNTQITLSAQDNENGSGILKTEYSLDNGQIWQNYINPIILDQDGIYNIKYKSTDRAGNIEEENEQNIKIDKTKPEINIFLPFQEEYLHSENLNIEYDISDNLSGFATDTQKIILDGQEINTITLDLFNYNLGVHTLEISAQDLAGNNASEKIDFIIGTDMSDIFNDISRINDENLIANDQAKKYLIKELEQVKNKIEKLGKKQTKKQENFNKIFDKCKKIKDETWCENKLKTRFDKVIYKFSEVHKEVIVNQLQTILRQLDLFYRKQWIYERGYEIIEEDILWLIFNIK